MMPNLQQIIRSFAAAATASTTFQTVSMTERSFGRYRRLLTVDFAIIITIFNVFF